jgi:uridine phosphorylase
MERYFKFKGIQPQITIDKIEAGIAFLFCPPERALEIAEKSSSYEKVTEQREFVTYKGKHGSRECDTGCCWCCEIYHIFLKC